MRKGKRLIDRPILSLADGVGVGSVKDVILGADNDLVVGLLVQEGGLLSSSQVVPLDEIESFGPDAVVVSSRESVVAADQVPEIKAILSRGTSLVGIKVFTETGEAEGTVNDIYFEESTGRVSALEVTGGRLKDFTNGLRNLLVEEVVRTGPEVLFVRPESAEAMAAQRGGVTGALADAGDRAKEAGSKVGAEAGQLGERARTSAGNAADAASSRAAEQHPEDQLVGRRTARDVEDDQGAVLVPGGKTLTQDDIARARDAGKTGDLFVAVGAERLQAGTADVSDAAGTAGDQAAGLWDTFTRKLGEMTDATGRRVDEEQTKRRLAQIEDAVGRPVTKVILDLEDHVVLDVGDIVTHRAVQQAHEAGALDSLIGSVYTAQIQFDKAELRAQRPGAASLEQAEGGEGAPLVAEMRGKVEQAQAEREASAEQRKADAEEGRQARAREREQRASERDRAATGRKQARAAEPASKASSPSSGSRPMTAVGPGASGDADMPDTPVDAQQAPVDDAMVARPR
jgi:uncharacterized protein YrrD